ncbi:hypothetical protein D3C87_1187190 [compost metagenome]
MRLGVAHDIGQCFLKDAKQTDRLGIAERRQIVRHLHQTRNLRTRLEAAGLPFNGRGDAGIENRWSQCRRHIPHQLEQLRDQALHAVQAVVQTGVQLRVGQFAHGRFQLQHGEHLAQLVVNFPGNACLFLFPYAFKVRGQFAQLLAGAGQFQFDALALADVPDNAVPDVGTVFKLTGNRLDFGPALFALTRKNSPLPRPVAVGVQRVILGLVITRFIVRMHKAAQAFVTMSQRCRRVTHQTFAALADVGKVDLPRHRRAFQAKDQSGNVRRDPLQPRFTFLQCREGTTALGDVREVDHQVFTVAKTQEAQRDIRRQNAAVGPQAMGFETLWRLVAGPGALPQVQPAIHVQAGFEVDQWPVDDPARWIAQHGFRRTVGIAHVTVPVDPKDADSALIDGKLRQP